MPASYQQILQAGEREKREKKREANREIQRKRKRKRARTTERKTERERGYVCVRYIYIHRERVCVYVHVCV